MKESLARLAVATLLASTLAGCSVFDRDTRDKAACDEISKILTAAGESEIPTGASPDLIMAIEKRALPLASGRFGNDIKKLVDSYNETSSGSIFDVFAGFGDTFYFGGAVLERCYELSSRIRN
jgi:hypothetical protein